MGRLIRYVSQEKKTMDETGRRYLSGINCTPELAQKSFLATKNLYGKANGTFFYQYVQSFSPKEEVTPAEAHQIAQELAERFFPGCEVLVATHKRGIQEENRQAGKQRDEFMRQLSTVIERLRRDGEELQKSFRRWAATTIMCSVAGATAASILVWGILG